VFTETTKFGAWATSVSSRRPLPLFGRLVEQNPSEEVVITVYKTSKISKYEGDWPMKVTYDRETDTMTITLREERIRERDEVHPGVIADFAEDGGIVGKI
jgi:Protein of unknown function (DUF2283)